MKNKTITLVFALISPFFLFSQEEFKQYFDGADTAAWNSIFIHIDTSATNLWQIGPPQKTIFDDAATQPNVLVTDTINYYPPSNTSSFSFDVDPSAFSWGAGIFAVQWTQKLDFDAGFDGGLVEYTVNNGDTWQNVFNDPYVYNFYGFDAANQDTLATGEEVFSGTDNSWKDIWLCFDVSWLSFSDTLTFRFTMVSDSLDNNKEGWMIDNLLTHITFIHTVNAAEAPQEKYIEVHPNPSNGALLIQTRKTESFHIIEEIEVINSAGRVVRRYGISPTKFKLDLRDLPNGNYYLKIKTNLQTETIPIVIQY